ncbi:paeninodin family lasso peptide [Bacillus sp. 1P10SD]|uniref:paeninodin family lasso peptide n=1 Tax=Bacillus sp. 1P10SD TaxID=3132265 RepID=UPI0039A43A97
MKKTWKQPTLETLDVKMTMWNLWGTKHDGAWTEDLSNTVPNPNGDGTMAEAQMS